MSLNTFASGTFNFGDRIRLSATFTGITSGLVDPTAITVAVQGAVVASYPGTIVRDGVGLYHFDWLANQENLLLVDWYSAQVGLEGHGIYSIFINQPS